MFDMFVKVSLTVAIAATVVLVIVMLVSVSVYELVRGPMEAEIAVGQVKDDVEAYQATRALASNIVPNCIYGVSILLICVVWVMYYISLKIGANNGRG